MRDCQVGGLEAQSCSCHPWEGREVVVALKPELSEFNGRLTFRRDGIPDNLLMTHSEQPSRLGILVSHMA